MPVCTLYALWLHQRRVANDETGVNYILPQIPSMTTEPGLRNLYNNDIYFVLSACEP